MAGSLLWPRFFYATATSRSGQGWLYPDRDNLTDDIPLGSFKTRQECARSAKEVLSIIETAGDYECGFRCKPATSIPGLHMCEKTEG
jgi:hypothetical protein